MGKAKKILVLYTGGTFGMKKDAKGVLNCVPNELEEYFRSNPQFHDPPCGAEKVDEKLLRTWSSKGGEIFYRIVEYNPLIDSSNITVAVWITLANDVAQFYNSYDGFVIIHGTDTLCYSAAALSFILENLNKAVILTGSMIPVYEPLTDGASNFRNSLTYAADPEVTEVCVCFNDYLYRGNRTTKSSSYLKDAFVSPNCPHLDKIGEKKKSKKEKRAIPAKPKPFPGGIKVFKQLCAKVALFFLHPTLTPEEFWAVACRVDGIILCTYGQGNVPSDNSHLLKVIKEAACRGKLIVNVTQPIYGAVTGNYAAGSQLAEMGVVSGLDMTKEAAYTKLLYILGHSEYDYAKKKMMMSYNIRGELTGEFCRCYYESL